MIARGGVPAFASTHADGGLTHQPGSLRSEGEATTSVLRSPSYLMTGVCHLTCAGCPTRRVVLAGRLIFRLFDRGTLLTQRLPAATGFAALTAWPRPEVVNQMSTPACRRPWSRGSQARGARVVAAIPPLAGLWQMLWRDLGPALLLVDAVFAGAACDRLRAVLARGAWHASSARMVLWYGGRDGRPDASPRRDS